MEPTFTCFPEVPIPAEQDHGAGLCRFTEEDENGVLWHPDLCPEGHLEAEEAILLDKRGVTRHLPAASALQPSSPRQTEFWRAQTAYKNSIAAKLRSVGMFEDASSLEECHSYYTVAVCGECGAVRKFPNRCDQFFCPECNHHLTAARTAQVSWWLPTIQQPKHVVLTIKNISNITPLHIDELRGFFTKLRHRKAFKNWRGGFYSLQITKSKNGWHPHIHCIIDVRWIDPNALASAWRAITRNAGQVVKVMDCREKGYLRRVTSYIARGSDMASWQPQEIADCISAFRGRRTFGVFGSLYGMRSEFAEWVAELKQKRPRCQCGSCNVKYFSEAEYASWDLHPTAAHSPRPPPMTDQQKELVLAGPQWPD